MRETIAVLLNERQMKRLERLAAEMEATPSIALQVLVDEALVEICPKCDDMNEPGFDGRNAVCASCGHVWRIG